MEKVYYIESVSCCMPYYTECTTYNYGVLERYIDKEYSRSGIDKIIAEMIIKHPYINGSMFVRVCIEYKYFDEKRNRKIKGIYHNLRFDNDNYKNQTEDGNGVKYEL